MKKIKLHDHTENKKLTCNWTDNMKYLIHYRMLNFYVRHGMVVEEFHEILSFKQSKWLENYVRFIT